VAQSYGDNTGCTFVVLAAVAAYFIFFPTSWQNAIWYGAEYRVSMTNVYTDPKPKDCDFIHAPLGDKGCSYKSRVKAFNAAGVLGAMGETW